MNRISVVLLLGLFMVMVTQGCKKDPNPEVLTEPAISRMEVLQFTAEDVIIPAYEQHNNSMDSLVTNVQQFSARLSKVSLVELRSQFKSAIASWKQCELYNLGDIKYNFLHQKIHTWPAQTTFISNSISGTDSITPQYIDQKGSSSKGYAAIEYLLFDNGQSVDTVLELYSNSRRLDYLVATVQQLNKDSKQLTEEWRQYVPSFYSKDGSSLVSSLNQLVNEMVALNEKVLGAKVGKPSGKTTGAAPDSSLLELHRSGASIVAIRSNVVSLEKVIFGNTSLSGKSLSDYLNGITRGDDLSNRIRAQFIKLNDLLDNTNAPLKTMIYTQSQEVEAIYNATKDLLVLLKVEFSSQLSVMLTINDNDGD